MDCSKCNGYATMLLNMVQGSDPVNYWNYMVSLNISHIMFHLANLMLATSAIMHLKNSSVRFRRSAQMISI